MTNRWLFVFNSHEYDYKLNNLMKKVGKIREINLDNCYQDLLFNFSALSLYRWGSLKEKVKTLVEDFLKFKIKFILYHKNPVFFLEIHFHQ